MGEGTIMADEKPTKKAETTDDRVERLEKQLAELRELARLNGWSGA